MKRGCVMFLIVFAAAYGGYEYLLRGTQLGDLSWLPPLLAFLDAVAVSNFWGLDMALKKQRACNMPRNKWTDGALVGLSGRLEAVRDPVIAPFSGEPSLILDYAVKRDAGRDSKVSDFSGFLMAPCAVHSRQGEVRLIGFPMLAQIPEQELASAEAFRKASEYFSQCTFQELGSNPFSMLKQLQEVLESDDAQLRADFRAAGAPAATAPEELAGELREYGYRLYETKIRSGAEVTVFGTYDQKKQAVDVGSGLSNLVHSVALGGAADVAGKGVRSAVISTICWTLAAVAANWCVAGQLGMLGDKLTFGLF